MLYVIVVFAECRVEHFGFDLRRNRPPFCTSCDLLLRIHCCRASFRKVIGSHSTRAAMYANRCALPRSRGDPLRGGTGGGGEATRIGQLRIIGFHVVEGVGYGALA